MIAVFCFTSSLVGLIGVLTHKTSKPVVEEVKPVVSSVLDIRKHWTIWDDGSDY